MQGPFAVPSSVVYLRLRGLSDQPAADQQRRRDALSATVRAIAGTWPASARVVLDAPDGLAVVGRGDVALALDAACRAVACDDVGLGIGLHHGDVEVHEGEQGVRLGGDALAVAALVAGSGSPRRVIASGAFREALAAQAADAADALTPQGSLQDASRHTHRLYAADDGLADTRRRRRRLLGAATVVGILGVGVALRLMLDGVLASRQPAVLVLDVRPSGEVLVDGVLKGTTPPLKRLSVPPGAHSIEIRNARFKPLKMDVQLEPGQELQLQHVFGGAGKSLLDRLRFW